MPVAPLQIPDRSTLGDHRPPAPAGRKLVEVKVGDLIRLIESDGWKHVRTTGSHRHFKYSTKPHVVTVPGRPGDDIPVGTLKAILRSAGLEEKR